MRSKFLFSLRSLRTMPRLQDKQLTAEPQVLVHSHTSGSVSAAPEGQRMRSDKVIDKVLMTLLRVFLSTQNGSYSLVLLSSFRKRSLGNPAGIGW